MYVGIGKWNWIWMDINENFTTLTLRKAYLYNIIEVVYSKVW